MLPMVASRRERVWTVAVLTVALFGICLYCLLVSRYRILWSDELFGWELVRDPSWRHMLRAWQLGADGGGISFYVLCRLWLGLFGHTKLAFRGFSAAGVFLAFATMWALLRRFYRPEIVAITLFTVWLGSRTILWQIVQTRFYGLLLASSALAFLAALPGGVQRGEDETNPTTHLQLLAAFGANFLLVSTHPLGLAYSAALLLAFVLVDGSRKRLRFRLYVAVLCSWSVLLFSMTAIKNSAAVGKPWFWTIKPTLLDLQALYEPLFWPTLPKLVLLVFAVALLWPGERRKMAQAVRQRRYVLLPGLFLALVPVVVWVLSRRGTSYFVDRYLISFTLGIAVLMAEALTQALPRELSWRRPFPLVLTLVAVLLYKAGWDGLHQFPRDLFVPPFDFTGDLALLLPRGEPVLIPRVDVFDLMAYYRDAPDLPILFPTDLQMAEEPESPRGLVSGVNEMLNWRKAGYYSSQIVDSAQFLATAQEFIVVNDASIPWMQQRLGNNPHWKLTKLGDFAHGYWSATIWRVTRQR